ncbi:hypothetical protein BCV70DRAFT_19692 [Testicularia cyperi]|uniref:Uncharacterized protein n=1 Tax=Testicularia cyperi TaxID=1882483 RepID=A0A317Y1S1_9BASI|nr:hypothetical protein BCV70DRAFT_19692 [Testicularia cyperi]
MRSQVRARISTNLSARHYRSEWRCRKAKGPFGYWSQERRQRKEQKRKRPSEEFFLCLATWKQTSEDIALTGLSSGRTFVRGREGEGRIQPGTKLIPICALPSLVCSVKRGPDVRLRRHRLSMGHQMLFAGRKLRGTREAEAQVTELRSCQGRQGLRLLNEISCG